METYDTSKVNAKLINAITKEIEELFKIGKSTHDLGKDDDLKDIDGIGKYILLTDEEKYDALQRLGELTKFKNVTGDKLYKLNGLTMKIGGKNTTIPLILPIDKFEKLAEQAEFLEHKLKDLNLKFPSQLFQFKKEYKGKNMPGKDFQPPLPQSFEMSDEEYEKYLETYYKTHGVDKKPDGIAFREPYPHERINYREGNEEKEEFTNEYFSDQHKKHAKGKGKATPAPVGERIKVTASSVKYPSRKEEKDKVTNSINWAKISSIVIKTAAIAAGVVAAGTILRVGPASTILIASAAGAYALGRWIRKTRLKNKIVSKDREKDKEEEKIKEKGEAPVVTKTKEKEKEHTEEKPTKDHPAEPPKAKESKKKEAKYNHDDMVLAEEEIGLDAVEFNRIDTQINAIYAEVQKLMASSSAADVPRLKELQEVLEQLINERLELTQRLMERQERLMDDIGLPRKSR